MIAAGITVHEALKAYEQADRRRGSQVRMIDAYSVKPIDKTTLEGGEGLGGKLVTVEDHWPEGGLGDAVLEAFAARPLNNLRWSSWP